MGDDGGIRIPRLSKQYGATPALDARDLQVRSGETFGILGPNGAGKSTLLNMLATLVEPSEGDAEIFGLSLRRQAGRVKEVVGLAPQQLSLYPNLSGEENLVFFGRVYGLGRSVALERAGRLLELVGLSRRRDDMVSIYSGGMQRRLNLACSLIHEPRLLLLDEPTVGVDPQSRDHIFETLERLSGQGITVIYTTHYMEEAERLCNRVAILDAGRVIAQGTLPELHGIVGLGEVIEIRTDGRPVDPALLEKLPEVGSAEATPELTRIFVKSAARALAPLSAALAQQSHRIEHLEIYPVDLGRVFMHLTGRALRD